MADGATFQIDITATTLGVDASADQLNALADKMQSVDKVATSFDAAVKAASDKLADAAKAATEASSALRIAETSYNGLEAAANRASKKLEAATAAGKSAEVIGKLKAQYDDATKAMNAGRTALDAARTKSLDADAAHTKLAGTLKTLQGAQKNAGKAVEQATPPVEAMGGATMAAVAAVAAMVVGLGVAAKRVGAFAVHANPAFMMRLAVATQRWQYNLKQAFLGLKFDKLADAADRLTSVFSQQTAAGRGLKKIVETLIQPLIDAAVKAEPYVAEFFKGLVYGALLAIIAVLKLRNAIFNAMSPETRAAVKQMVGKVATLETAFTLGAIAGAALALVLGIIAVALLGIVVTIAILLAPFVALGYAIYWVVDNFGLIIDAIGKFVTDVGDTFVGMAKDAYNWGADIINGLIDGITGKTVKLKGAADGAAKAVEDALKGKLEIHSPSKLTARIGGYVADGMVEGMEGGERDVAYAGRSLAGALEDGASSSVTTSTSTATSSRTVHVGSITINAGSGSADDIEAAVRRALLSVAEGVALSIGGGEVPA